MASRSPDAVQSAEPRAQDADLVTAPSPATPSNARGNGFRALLSYARPVWKTLLLGGVLGLVGNVVALIQPMAAKAVIETITGEGIASYKPLVWLLVCVIVAAALSAVGAYVLERAAARVVTHARSRLVRHIMSLRVGEMERPGDLISRVTADTTLLSRACSEALSSSVNSVVMLVGAVVMMGLLDGVLLAATVAVLTVLVVIAVVVMPRIAAAQTHVQNAVGEIGSGMERTLGAFRTVKAAGAENLEVDRLSAVNESAYRSMLTTAKWTALARVAAGLATQVAFLVVLGLGGFRVASGDLTVASLVAFLLYLFGLAQPIGTLMQDATDVQSGLAAVGRLEMVYALQAEPSVDKASRREQRDGGEPRGGMAVEFVDVDFSYGTSAKVLTGFSLSVEPGEMVALIGDSGVGKTTIFSLIQRFVDVDGGSIRLDGLDVRDWDLGQLRSNIGYVEQDAPVLEGTMRENLTYGLDDVSEEAVRRVVRKVRLESEIERMPEGLDSRVGHRGMTLSGGQRQRVAIARALLREPRLLLLDEATSQLDGLNEEALRDVVAGLAGSTTVVVIAHRLSTIVDADLIVRLASGRAQAAGNHHELLLHDATYAELVGVGAGRRGSQSAAALGSPQGGALSP